MLNPISKDHRLFYVNGKLEFALFYDKSIKDKEIIINTFLESKDWKWYKSYYEVKKVKKIEVSKDLKEFRITCK
jgi:hypothetical protein